MLFNNTIILFTLLTINRISQLHVICVTYAVSVASVAIVAFGGERTIKNKIVKCSRCASLQM